MMLSRIGGTFLGGICAVLVASNAPAALLLFEPFNYPNGSLIAVSGGLWSTHSGTTGEVEVISGRVDLRVPATEDVNASLGQTFPANTSAVLYASFTINFTALPSSGGAYFAHFKGSGTSIQRGKIFAFTTGAGAGQYRLGIANFANTPVIAAPGTLNTNVDYRVYVRYVVSNATTTLWVEPATEASPAVTASDITTPAALTSFALRQDAGIGVLGVDDLRVGTSFAEVYTGPNTIPPSITQQPANVSAIEGGSATFIVEVTGTAPLFYQWKFNSNPIAGATNATLNLQSITTNHAGAYSVFVSNAGGMTNSSSGILTVIQPNASGTLSLVHYNVKGNFASDWSTNAAQVQAIARQLQYLNPDIITLNEIPNGLRYEMINWMVAFFPAYTLAISSGTDGTIRSGVISRFPITRAQSWLDDSDLTSYGYGGTFTRDLFEAEITVPGATESLHVFTTHLKSGSDSDSQNRRAAECSAISNFFTTVFLSTNAGRPYLLTGDLNEDIAISMSQNNHPIQRLTAEATGLQLTTPINPVSLSRYTHSIQGSLDARIDYVMPAGVLGANIFASQVFRTDLLVEPPSPLQPSDSVIASDHLPVQMIFNYPDPPLRVTSILSNQSFALSWSALVGRKFAVESSLDLTTWSVIASNIVTTTGAPMWTTSATNASRFFRVVRVL